MCYHQFSSVAQLCPTPQTAARQASLSITNSQSLFKLMPFALMMPSNHLILCHPLLLLPSIFPSIRVFSAINHCPAWIGFFSFIYMIHPSGPFPFQFYYDFFRDAFSDPTVKLAAKSLQSCPTVRPQRRQPTRLPRPWDSPGKNTGVGCHFLFQCRKVKSESEIAQSCPTLSDPMDYSPPGSSIHGICQARVLEWGAIAFSDSETWVSTNVKCPFSF